MSSQQYIVHKIYGPTLQGEGSLVGSRTCFVRFAGCNMWSGREEDRAASACAFCDTEFRGGKSMTALEIGDALDRLGARWCESITLSGGEPLLQVDHAFLRALGDRFPGVLIVVETNGAYVIPRPVDVRLFVVCSPKVPFGSMRLDRCDNLKVLLPHPNPRIKPTAFNAFPAAAKYVQPVNHRNAIDEDNLKRAVQFVLTNPGWRLSMQAQKFLGVD